MQLRIVSKEEAHKLIDSAPGSTVLVLSYDNKKGISDCGKKVRKKKGKKIVDKYKMLVLADSSPIMTINLHDYNINNLSFYNTRGISKSIALVKME